MLIKMKELMDEVYGQKRSFLFEWIASLISSHNSTQEDYDDRLRQLYLMEAYILEQPESKNKEVFLRRINQSKKILLNDIISGQLDMNDGNRYFLLWQEDDCCHDGDEWIAIALSKRELKFQIERKRKDVETYIGVWKDEYSNLAKLRAYEYIPNYGFRMMDLEKEVLSDEVCE